MEVGLNLGVLFLAKLIIISHYRLELGRLMLITDMLETCKFSIRSVSITALKSSHSGSP